MPEAGDDLPCCFPGSGLEGFVPLSPPLSCNEWPFQGPGFVSDSPLHILSWMAFSLVLMGVSNPSCWAQGLDYIRAQHPSQSSPEKSPHLTLWLCILIYSIMPVGLTSPLSSAMCSSYQLIIFHSCFTFGMRRSQLYIRLSVVRSLQSIVCDIEFMP